MISNGATVEIGKVLKAATFLIAFLTFLTVCVYVPPVFFAIFLLLFFAAAWCEWRGRFAPRTVLIVASLSIIGLFVYRLRLTDLAPQAVETLLLLLAIKLLEEKRFRDYMQIYGISVFLLAGSALFGVNLIFLSYVVTLAFFFNAAMVLVTYHKEDPGSALTVGTLKKLLWKSALIPLCAIPLGALLFFIIPRTPFPLLNFLNQGSRSSTGFSDQVRLGKVSDIQEDNSIIFRAATKRVPETDLYWRGIVMDHFDGTTWKPVYRRIVPRGSASAKTSSAPIWQEIYLEPYGNTYLFALDRPSQILLRSVKEHSDRTFSSEQPLTHKIRYRAMSALESEPPSDSAGKEHYVQLPANLSTAVTEMARRLRSERGPKETLDAIGRFFNDGQFTYSLTGLPITPHPLEDFLFTRKSGNCEYFASAFAVLARINGIPARLVAGYHGGSHNDLSGYYLVSQKDAHVWVEAFVPGAGWLRYDPTPSAGGQAAKEMALLSRVRLYLDEINYLWAVFIVNYDVQKQYALFANTGSAITAGSVKVGSIPLKRYLIPLFCAVAFAYGCVVIRRRSRKSPSERLIRRLLKQLEKRGYTRKASQGLEEFVTGIGDAPLRDRAWHIVREFEATYYRDEPFSKTEVRRLRRLIREIRDS